MSNLKIINLDKVISSMIHHPKIDGMPLYSRVDGQLEYGDGRVNNTKGLRWEEASKRSYSSPDNIRRVFITVDAVYVHLYKPVVGVKNNSLHREVEFPVKLSQVYDNMCQNRDYGAKLEYSVRQTGLGALCRPWVCSNIEEVYFDWGVFLSTDVQNFGFGDFFEIYKSGTPGLKPFEPIKSLFEIACLKGVKSLSDRFPRLRCIGYMQDLSKIYTNVTNKSGAESLEDMMKPWYMNSIVEEAIKSPLSAVSIYKIPNVPKLNTNYSVKDGIYIFDRDVLKDYFKNLEARIREYNRSKIDKQLDDKKDALVKKVKTIKSSFESNIDDIYAKEGPIGASIALTIALSGLSKAEKLEMFNNMSGEGQERYKRLIKLED